jgi:hypothetical protein
MRPFVARQFYCRNKVAFAIGDIGNGRPQTHATTLPLAALLHTREGVVTGSFKPENAARRFRRKTKRHGVAHPQSLRRTGQAAGARQWCSASHGSGCRCGHMPGAHGGHREIGLRNLNFFQGKIGPSSQTAISAAIAGFGDSGFRPRQFRRCRPGIGENGDVAGGIVGFGGIRSWQEVCQ